jgi:hypothetical protein
MDHLQRNFIGDFKGVDTFIYVAPADRVVAARKPAVRILFMVGEVAIGG